MSRTIRISDRLYTYIQGHARPFEETPSDVIERLLGVDKGADADPSDRVRESQAPVLVLDVERYRDRYPGEREATFEAYCEVWRADSAVLAQFGGWTTFSRCANAEPACLRDMPERVEAAEEAMRRHGYVADDSGRPGRGRRWSQPE